MQDDKGRLLLDIARSTLSEEVGLPAKAWREEPWLQEWGACFVTLRLQEELRGCIGSLEAYRPLLTDVRENAMAAAFRDPRFPPLTADELPRTTIEISLLSPLEEMTFESEADLLSQLRPGVDGLLLEHGPQRGTFLPAVWRGLAEPEAFLRQLKRKAGLEEDFWSAELSVRRYTTRTWSDEPPVA